MNLSKLFEMQKELDDYIVKTKGLEGQDLLPQKILALQVELGECANEWRGFKFWSENQNPRNYCQACNMIETEHVHKNPLLEEYVDCLHFILSIGLTGGYNDSIPALKRNINGYKTENLMNQFSKTIGTTAYFKDEPSEGNYFRIVMIFIGLGEMLGFTWEQIEQAYTDKWNINKQRQTNGY